MTTAVSRINPEAYLAAERQSEGKCEYENGKIIPMGGASKEHNQIVRNLLTLLWNHLEGKKEFEPYATDLRIYCPEDRRYYYPDLVITRGEEQFQDGVFDTLLNPFLVIEVLSDTTEARDRGAKFEAYRSIDSLREYVLVSQKNHTVEGFYKNDRGEWVIAEPVHGEEAVFSFRNLELTLALKEVYRKVKMPEPAEGEEMERG